MKQSNWAIRIEQESRSPTVERRAEGFVLVDPNQIWSWPRFIIALVFLTLWNGISGFALVASLRVFSINPGAWVGLVVGGLFCLIGVLILAGLLYSAWLNLRLFPGELVLPRYPLRLGEDCTVQFRRRFRMGRPTQAGTLEAQLVCYEWVKYRQGTDYSTATHVLLEKPLRTQTAHAGATQLSYEERIAIPVQGPPSFEARYNQIRWELKVSMHIPGIGRDTSVFRLTVEPEVLQ